MTLHTEDSGPTTARMPVTQAAFRGSLAAWSSGLANACSWRNPAFTSRAPSPNSSLVPMPDAPDFATLPLAELAQYAVERRLPPVERWHPDHCGDSDMRIASDGTWFHQGNKIARPEMVRLFSTILRREDDGSYVLVTPAEKLTIAVDDAPFVALEMKCEGDGAAARLAFRLNTDEVVVAGADHRLRFADDGTGRTGPRPYLGVRKGLDALIARPLYYELAEIALAADTRPPGVWSDGVFFAMAES